MDNSICINHSIGNIPANDFKMMISDHYRENNMNGNDEILPQTAIKISIKGNMVIEDQIGGRKNYVVTQYHIN